MSSAEVRQVLMDLLATFASFCEQNGLRYFLAYGSLLGAVREGDLIPWDDDIDVAMPRPDYNRFRRLYHSQPNPNTKLLSPGDAGYPTPFMKLIDTRTGFEAKDYVFPEDYGVCMDIFPLDGVSPLRGALQFRAASRLRKIQYRLYPHQKWRLNAPAQTPLSLLKKGAWHLLKAPRRFPSWVLEKLGEAWTAAQAFLLRWSSRSQLASWSDKLISLQPFERAPQTADMVGWHRFQDALIDRAHVEQSEQVRFGDMQVRTFAEPEQLLAKWYGPDWNVPNPDFKGPHGRAFWRTPPAGHPNSAAAPEAR